MDRTIYFVMRPDQTRATSLPANFYIPTLEADIIAADQYRTFGIHETSLK
jgi:hypothetical protein